MRRLTAFILAGAIAPLASAHPLGEEHSFFEQVYHQLSSMHHLPLLLALGAVVFFVHRQLSKNRR